VDLEQSGLVAEWSCRWVDLRLGGLAAGWTCSRADLEQMAGLLDEQTFEQVVRSTPLCSIDLVLRDPDARTLVGLRTNEPAKGFYFVPGGIIRKDERMADAFGRILMQETSIEAELSEARYLGVFEHFYATNKFEKRGFGTHYICHAHGLALGHRPAITADRQHSELIWASAAELSKLNLHPYSAAYFGPEVTNQV
jgi:colanic acid biosynthesis protein WcaH